MSVVAEEVSWRVSRGDRCTVTVDLSGPGLSVGVVRPGDGMRVAGFGPLVSGGAGALLSHIGDCVARVIGRVVAAGGAVVQVVLAVPAPFDYALGVAVSGGALPELAGWAVTDSLSSRLGVPVRAVNSHIAGAQGMWRARGARPGRVVVAMLDDPGSVVFLQDGRAAGERSGALPRGGADGLTIAVHGADEVRGWAPSSVRDWFSPVAFACAEFERRTGEVVDGAGLAAAAARGDVDAVAVLDLVGADWGEALGVLCGSFAPQQVWLGGVLAGAGACLVRAVRRGCPVLSASRFRAVAGGDFVHVGAGAA